MYFLLNLFKPTTDLKLINLYLFFKKKKEILEILEILEKLKTFKLFICDQRRTIR